MTRSFDKAFVAMGVDADDLSRVRGRSVIYAGLTLMAVGTIALVAGILTNISA